MVCSIEIKALSSGPKWFLKPLNAKLNGHRDKFCYYCKQWAEIFSNSAFQKTFFSQNVVSCLKHYYLICICIEIDKSMPMQK